MEHVAFDLERARRDTPGCDKVLHFNNAGSALVPRVVLDAVTGYLELEAEIGGYEAADRAKDAVEHVYDALSTLIGCGREEIAVIENATRAWDMAFYAIPFKHGDRILTSMAEYASNYLAFLQISKRTGVKIEVIPNDERGQLSVEALRHMVDDRVKLIAITHIPTNGGLVNPAAEVGKIAREANVLYLLDACQSVGHMPVNVLEIGCDMLSATGRKYLRGPRGTGFLYVRRDLIEELEPPFLDLHAATWIADDEYEIRSDARRFENWETNYAGKVGLGVAVDYALGWGMPPIWKRICEVSKGLRIRLNDLSGVATHDLGAIQCGIVSFTVEGKNPSDIQRQLNEKNINISVSVAPSTLLDMESRSLSSILRASVHYYNNEEEVVRFCEALRRFL